MDAVRFDRLVKGLAGVTSRRAMLQLAALGLGAALPTGWARAKKNKHKSKLKRNDFGCVDVGKPCRGKSANCCSGVCEGKKPKKGKKDKSRCVDHDAGSCQPEQDACVAPTAPCAEGAECFRTTGKGSFCGLAGDGACAACQKDADCEARGFGPGAACVICPPPCPTSPFTACVPPAP